MKQVSSKNNDKFIDTKYRLSNYKLGFVKFLHRKWHDSIENRIFIDHRKQRIFMAIAHENHISICPMLNSQEALKSQQDLEQELLKNSSTLLDFYKETLSEAKNLFQKSTFEIASLYGKDESADQHIAETIKKAVSDIQGTLTV